MLRLNHKEYLMWRLPSKLLTNTTTRSINIIVSVEATWTHTGPWGSNLTPSNTPVDEILNLLASVYDGPNLGLTGVKVTWS